MDRFTFARELMARVVPGQWFTVEPEQLRDIQPLPGFTVPESIMENIVGAAYEWSVAENDYNGRVTFKRRETPLTNGLRTYVPPDRKHLFKQRADGLFEPI